MESVEVDLKELRNIDPDLPGMFANLTLRARRVIRYAHELALQRRAQPIPNRLFLAAFLMDEKGHARRVLAAKGLPAVELFKSCVESATGNAPSDFPLSSETCSRIVAPTIQRAKEIAGTDLITEQILFRAFCELAEPLMKAPLKNCGIDLDVLGSYDLNTTPKPKPPAKRPSAGHGDVQWN